MVDYFDDTKKERWRKDHPGFPEPQVWCTDATAEATPRPALLAFGRAQGTRWTSRLTYARGTHMDSDGTPAYHVDLIPLYDEAENPVLTKTGQQANKEQKTDQQVIVESVVLRAVHEDGRWVCAVWERRIPRIPYADTGWKFAGAWTHKRKLKATEIGKVLKE